MYFFKRTKTMLRNGLPYKATLVLALLLAINSFSGAAALAAAAQPNTISAQAIQLQTYGTLPVMIFNLTQSPINFGVSSDHSANYISGGYPIAIGLSGMFNPQSTGDTIAFPNVTTPFVPADGVVSASLMPAVIGTTTAGTTTYAANSKWSFMNVFNFFPSWSGSVNYGKTQYGAFGSINSLGATPGPVGVQFAAAPSVTAYAQSMNNESNASIWMKLYGGTTTPIAEYTIGIQSLGGAVSAYQPNSSSQNPVDWLGIGMGIMGDIDSFCNPDVYDMAGVLYGLYNSFAGMFQTVSDPLTTNQAYPAKYNGVTVSTASTTGTQLGTMTLLDGSVNYQMNVMTATTSLPIEQQNGVFAMTWRQAPQGTSVNERNSADTLIVVVINNGLYSSNSVQNVINKYLNSGSPSQISSTGLLPKSTKEQAADTFKILEIIKAIAQKDPQDAKSIIDTFGFNGQYQKEKNNPAAIAKMKASLKTIFAKHQQEIPTIKPYLTKMEQK